MFGGAAVRQPLAAPQAAAPGAGTVLGGPRRRSTRLTGKTSKLYPGPPGNVNRLFRHEATSPVPKDRCEGESMHCYFNLVSSHKTILDEEGIEVADINEARSFAREAVVPMISP